MLFIKFMYRSFKYDISVNILTNCKKISDTLDFYSILSYNWFSTQKTRVLTLTDTKC